MKRFIFFIFMAAAFLLRSYDAPGQVHILDRAWHHVRNEEPREWSEFPAAPGEKRLLIHFSAQPGTGEKTLSIRQYDVKLNWRILLNGHLLGSLIQDEKDLISYYKVPALQADNTLEISCAETVPDDIKIGAIVLDERPLSRILSEAHLSVEVVDAETGDLLPARITMTNAEGTLQSVSGCTPDPLAVRPGYVYTGSGQAVIGLPAGIYTIYATRGFEYGVDSARVELKAHDYVAQKFSIRHEVPTKGWVSSDTHIHTFTWSRHGDASAAERVLTIAGEGLELPVSTDHNINVDLKPFAIDQNVQHYFTSVTGDEVTTAVGHFNVFPVADESVIDYAAKTWKALSQNLANAKKDRVVILNHARDIHVNFRPFDPGRHLASAGMRLDGWDFPANAMEVINSGSQQTDQMQLTRDWFGMLNHGYFITPAGSSDSHDVSRYIVGQARTYIRCTDDDPGNLDVNEAVRNFREGNVMVSFGLLTEIEINNSYGPGELAPGPDDVNVSVKVSGPAWARAEKITLYANGEKIREESITDQKAAGTKWSGSWKLTLPAHDIFLVAVAEGPGDRMPYWPIGKPYQPVSEDWHPKIFGISGAVWVDGDRNGKRNSARDYAKELIAEAAGDPNLLIQSLASYDEAVAIQVAAELLRKGANLKGPALAKALRKAAPQTMSGFQVVVTEIEKSH